MESIPLGLVAAASLAGTAYLNARLGISTDIRQILDDRAWKKRLDQRIQSMGGACTLYAMFDSVNPDLEALWFEGKTWTYGTLKADANRLAGVLRSYGIASNDHVAVFSTNSPEMIIMALAISKLGAVSALINTNLRDDTFVYCLNVANAKLVISTPDLAEHVKSDLPHLSLNLYSFGGESAQAVGSQTASPLVALSPGSTEWINAEPVLDIAQKDLSDLAILIYTSGTTGKPKACGIRNMQVLVVSNPLSSDVNNPKKYAPLRTYSSLPLFHGTAFFTGLCYVVGCSGTFCLRRKFSASKFWEDVAHSKATRILYIGELCRYLLATPPGAYDQAHSCIVAHGNGLRREIWEEFKARFNVPEIREFYRSTEGLAKFDNHGEGVWGAGMVGFAGPIKRYMEDDTYLIRSDKETNVPIRDPKTGFCIVAGLGEPGEAIGRCRNRNFLSAYLGNEAATEEKLLHDVFEKGDVFQRMGDLLIHDPSGWVRFSDRVGDTFRWKGENVSAGEVRDHICELEEVEDAVVYGVKLERYDGQAGGAAITLKQHDAAIAARVMEGLHTFLRKKGLPAYAVPRLVRFTSSIGSGVTFKQAKGDLVKKGWSPTGPDSDILYWLDGSQYKALDEQSWRSIELGSAKL